ncbi:hypothetical protein B0H34DRAFT_801227 [Crassisporium funariophilum]|nr:hypothetical protein B0H34DRAFT_801227 [Crassisporium funariophilum]
MAGKDTYYAPTVEKPGQAHYNPHQQQQYPGGQPGFPQPQMYQQQAQPQHHHQQQYQGQPQMIYVQPHQPPRRDDSSSCCLPCAW